MTATQRLLLLISTILCLAAGSALPGVAADDDGHAVSREPVGPYGQALDVSALGKAALDIQTQTIERKPVPMEITVPGKIEVIPTRLFDQHAALSGRIYSVNVAPGDLVKQGQVLAIIDSPEMNQLAAQLLQSRLDIEGEIARQQADLTAEVSQAADRLELSQKNYERFKTLFEQKIAAEKDLIAAQAEYRIAKSKLTTAEANKTILLKTLRSRLELTLAPLRQRLEMVGIRESDIESMLKDQKAMTQVPLRAAKAGFITGIQASSGKSIDPSTSLFTIADLTKVWATAQVYEQDMGCMHVGEAVHVKVHALHGECVDGVLSYIGTQVDAQTRTLPVRAELNNSDYRLKPDMFAELFIDIGNANDIVAVPQDAIVMQSGKPTAFVYSGKGYQPVYVKTGRTIGDAIEVQAGLNPGQTVVTKGAFQLAAELLKNGGGLDQFAQATEGERESEDELKPVVPTGMNLSTQMVVVIIAVAFVLGFAVSALVMFKGRKSTAVIVSESEPATETRLPSADPVRSKSDHV